MPELAQMPDLNAAMERLTAAEAAETAPPTEAFIQTEVDPNAPPQPTGEPSAGVETTSDLPVEGTQAAETPAAPKVEDATNTEPAKPAEKSTPDKGSSFAKDKQRRDDSWKKLNEDKATFQKERDTLKAEREYIEREKAQLAEEKAQSSSRFTPEQYEQGAQSNAQKAAELELRADGLDKRAEAAENADRYDEARNLRTEATKARKSAAYHEGLADQLKQAAKEKRDNPDPTAAAIEQRNSQMLRDYTMEAASKWPDVFKQGSPLNQTVAEHLKAAREVGLDVKKHPVLIYQAARLTAAEAAAARVPSMNKELAELRAKVKELEAFTSPGGGLGAPANLQADRPNSESEEGAYLRQTANAIS